MGEVGGTEALNSFCLQYPDHSEQVDDPADDEANEADQNGKSLLFVGLPPYK